MAMDLFQLLMWVFATSTAILAVVFVWLIFAFIAPARSTFAKAFIKAKKKKMHIFMAWAGNHWKYFVCSDETEPDSYWVTESGRMVPLNPKSIGMTMGNVKLAVGEYENMKAYNVSIADVISMCAKHGVTPEKFREVFKAIDEMRIEDAETGISDVKKELGIKEVVKCSEGKKSPTNSAATPQPPAPKKSKS